MRRLLSDVDGRIRHVLLCLGQPRDVERVGNIVKGFDDDVTVTIAYDRVSGESLPSRFWVKTKRLLRKELSALETLVNHLPRGRRINLLALGHDPWLWAQDLIHVSEEKVILPSRSLKGHAASGTAKHSQQTSLEMVKHRFWSHSGFTVEMKDSGLCNSDGGELIVCGETVFIGGHLVDLYLQNQMGGKDVFTANRKTYEEARSCVFSGLESYEGERTFRLLAVNPFPFPGHLDMVFTPLSEKCFILADMKGAIAALNLPRGVTIKHPYGHYVDLLEKVADRIASQYPGVKLVRIPCIPPLVCGQETLNHFMSFNNVLQERFDMSNGVGVHRVYVPIFTVFLSPVLPKYIDLRTLLSLQVDAINVYHRLGLDVRPVAFPLKSGIGGGLRCSVKVLQRES